jgi:hypothetical protein
MKKGKRRSEQFLRFIMCEIYRHNLLGFRFTQNLTSFEEILGLKDSI